MGFWSKLFGRKDVPTLELPVSSDTPPLPAPTAKSIQEVEEQVEALLRELFPLESPEAQPAEDIEAEKKRKRSEAAKKAAATRAANKAKNK
jgi:hypothetical protein